MTEEELATRCKGGDRSAQKLLYDRYAAWMMGISMRYTSDEECSRDILHDSFLKIFGSIQRFEYRGTGSLDAWVSKIVVNTALAFLKKENNFVSLNEWDVKNGTDYSEPVEESDTALYDAVPDEAIMRCLGKLPAKLRTVFNLFMFEDMTHTDIARQLGLTESASRVRLHRAKTLLVEEIKEYIKRTEK
ncbi:MAG: RNA polymerase sigma factor [Bacteroides sp.]|nr:RNA polymerase sigma factor [Bacteroides sp.]